MSRVYHEKTCYSDYSTQPPPPQKKKKKKKKKQTNKQTNGEA